MAVQLVDIGIAIEKSKFQRVVYIFGPDGRRPGGQTDDGRADGAGRTTDGVYTATVTSTPRRLGDGQLSWSWDVRVNGPKLELGSGHMTHRAGSGGW